jgi:CRISPR-associated protein Csm1
MPGQGCARRANPEAATVSALAQQRLEAVLGALLHDIGKFAQRGQPAGERRSHTELGAQFVRELSEQGALVDYGLRDAVMAAVADHHSSAPQAHRELVQIVQLADRLAAQERLSAPVKQRDPAETPLWSVLAALRLETAPAGAPADEACRCGYAPQVLQLDDSLLPAAQPQVSPQLYAQLWAEFQAEAARVPAVGTRQQVATLLALLRKYTSFIPAATPWETDGEVRTQPDISLYDHLKITAAIAACLVSVSPDDVAALLPDPAASAAGSQVVLARLLRADLSGLQKFIYHIAEPAAASGGTARRLRGRSFYLVLFTEVLAEALLDALELPRTNLLFAGGGRFDVLLPPDEASAEAVRRWQEQAEQALLGLRGELGLQVAQVELHAGDFGQLDRVYTELEQHLRRQKARTLEQHLDREEFWLPRGGGLVPCPVCRLQPARLEGGLARACDRCEQHAAMGRQLPRTEWLRWHRSGEAACCQDGNDAVAVSFDALGWCVELHSSEPADDGATLIERLNDNDFLPDAGRPQTPRSFRFLANAAPLVTEGRRAPSAAGEQAEEYGPGDVLDFAALAGHYSQGPPLLGVLRGDVDRLGQLFTQGLRGAGAGGASGLSFSRLATLSSQLDLYFSGRLNRLCERYGSPAAAAGQASDGQTAPNRPPVEQVFYITYAGGDDFFLVGPWNRVLELAAAIEDDFRRFACGNPAVTLSAGVVLVKPTFPIARSAELSHRALEEAKDGGRNRIGLFEQTLPWRDGGAPDYRAMLALGEELARRTRRRDRSAEQAPIPRTLLHDLHQLHQRMVGNGGQADPMYAPLLAYLFKRRLGRALSADGNGELARLVKQVRQQFGHRGLRVALAYAILLTREV